MMGSENRLVPYLLIYYKSKYYLFTMCLSQTSGNKALYKNWNKVNDKMKCHKAQYKYMLTCY